MTLDLKIFLLITAWTLVVAFVTYWRGYARHQQETRHLESDLDAAIEAITGLSAAAVEARHRHPSQQLYLVKGDVS